MSAFHTTKVSDKRNMFVKLTILINAGISVSTEIPEWWACRSWQRITRKNKYKTEQVKAYSRD